MARHRTVWGLSLLVILLSGCASPSAPASSELPSSTPQGTETTSPEPEPVLEPTVAFDGDCARVLTSAQLDEFLGEGWMPLDDKLVEWDPERVIIPAVGSFGTLGGLECQWQASDDTQAGDAQRLEIVVLPAAQAPAGFAEDFSAPRCDPGGDGTSSCRLAATAGDAWVMVTFGYTYDEPPVMSLEGAVDAVSANLPNPFDGVAADPQAEWWTLPECAALGESMALEELIGDEYVNGYYEGAEQPEQALLAEAGVELTCPWYTGGSAPDGEFYIIRAKIAPGAGWNWANISTAPGSEKIAVDGAADAVVFPWLSGKTSVLLASDGVNVVEVGGADSAFLAQLAARVLAAVSD